VNQKPRTPSHKASERGRKGDKGKQGEEGEGMREEIDESQGKVQEERGVLRADYER
jgi:hypothetical protein